MVEQSPCRMDAAAAAKSLQPCPTLCDPIDSSPPGSPIPGILQARVLDWVAISFSNAWKWKVKVKSLSHVRLLVTPWTTAYQAPPSMDFPGKSTGVGGHCLLHCSTGDLFKKCKWKRSGGSWLQWAKTGREFWMQEVRLCAWKPKLWEWVELNRAH